MLSAYRFFSIDNYIITSTRELWGKLKTLALMISSKDQGLRSQPEVKTATSVFVSWELYKTPPPQRQDNPMCLFHMIKKWNLVQNWNFSSVYINESVALIVKNCPRINIKQYVRRRKNIMLSLRSHLFKEKPSNWQIDGNFIILNKI